MPTCSNFRSPLASVAIPPTPAIKNGDDEPTLCESCDGDAIDVWLDCIRLPPRTGRVAGGGTFAYESTLEDGMDRGIGMALTCDGVRCESIFEFVVGVKMDSLVMDDGRSELKSITSSNG